MSRPQPPAYVLSVEAYRAGDATLAGFPEPIRLASNENAYGASPAARAALVDCADQLGRYPDPSAAALRGAIARHNGIAAERIICGAGSDEIIQLIVRGFLRPGDEIVQSRFGFAIYWIFASAAGAVPVLADERDYTVDVDAILACVCERTRIVFVANPNNPTGTYVPASEILRLHRALPSDVLLVLDCAYAEYVGDGDYAAHLELAGAQQNVIVVRTFSKAYGLASVRLGWGYGAPEVIDVLHRVREPFNLSLQAQAVGLAALADQDFVAECVERTLRERARFAACIRSLGLFVVSGEANFVLVRFPEEPGSTAADADAFLRHSGIIVRRVDSYGLPDCLRITIGTAAECDAVLACLRQFLDGRPVAATT